MRKGLLGARCTGELERIASEAAQMLDSNALSMGERLRNALLRAHRTGELEMLRTELDELDDDVPELENTLPAGSSLTRERKKEKRVSAKQRWAELATSSESDFDPCQKNAHRVAAASSGITAAFIAAARAENATSSESDCPTAGARVSRQATHLSGRSSPGRSSKARDRSHSAWSPSDSDFE